MEFPQYQATPDTTRLIFPHVFKLLFLSAAFYGGIWFLTWTLRYSIPNIVNILIAAFLLILIVMQVLIYNSRFSKFKYVFYGTRVEAHTDNDETFYFNSFQNAIVKRNIFDAFFGTGTVLLYPNFRIGPVANPVQMKDYLVQLVQFNVRMQRSYSVPQPQYQYNQPRPQQYAQQPQAQFQQPAGQQQQHAYGYNPQNTSANNNNNPQQQYNNPRNIGKQEA
jgi:hypothetical protein